MPKLVNIGFGNGAMAKDQLNLFIKGDPEFFCFIELADDASGGGWRQV